MIRFENVTKKFGDSVALENINFSVEKGEFIFVTGPSGAGKTTLLRLLLRELVPTEGKIYIDNTDIGALPKKELPQLRRQVGAVFQDSKLLLDRTVYENIALALAILSKKEVEIEKTVKEVLSVVGLADKEKLFPRQLAGGEMQRVALARTLVMEPKIVFADEPTGNLDPQTSWQIADLLKKVNKTGITLMMATHNFEIVDSMGKRVIRLEKGKVVSDDKKGKYKK